MPFELAAVVLLAGRALLGGLFVFAGLRHIFFVLAPATGAVAARGLPYARAIVIGGSLFETVFGALLAAGIWPVVASLALFVFTVIASFMLLDFWNQQDFPRVALFNNLCSNVGVLGGLLISAGSAM